MTESNSKQTLQQDEEFVLLFLITMSCLKDVLVY